MKLISWNVNGLRAIVKKDFVEQFTELNADIVCLQETKLQEGQISLEFDGYHQYWHYAVKKGYSGTAIFSKVKPLNVTNGINIDEHDQEGRVMTAEYEDYFLVNCYTPNAQAELKRLDYRISWEKDFLTYLNELDKKKPVILCGDLNVAHQPIDLKNWERQQNSPGFSDEERECLTKLLASGFIDSFRYLHPDTKEAYSWWSYRFNSRKRNIGWRIDYVLVSNCLASSLEEAFILKDYTGSDHCPVGILLNV